MLLYLSVFGSLVAGVVLALAWWPIWGRRAALPTGPARGFTLAAAGLVLLSEFAIRFIGISSLFGSTALSALNGWIWDYRFAITVLVGVLGVTLLSLPIQARGGRGAAELTRRSWMSFARTRWLIAPGVLLALVLLLTVVAGLASRPDPMTGRHTMYLVELGGERAMGTTIYGWFYSVPVMVLTGLLIVATIAGMTLIARPALADDPEGDIGVRSIRTRNLLAAASATLLLHVGEILGSLAGTASIRSMFSTSEGPVRFWTTFSALEPVFIAASALSAVLGAALWTAIGLSGVRSRLRAVTAEP